MVGWISGVIFLLLVYVGYLSLMKSAKKADENLDKYFDNDMDYIIKSKDK